MIKFAVFSFAQKGGEKNMALYKRGNVWWYEFWYKGRRYREGVGHSKKQAESVLAKRKTEVRENRFFDVKKETNTSFDALAEEYLRYSCGNKKSYWRDVISAKHLKQYFASRRLADITPRIVERYKLMRVRKVKPSTVNRELACLKHMFTMAIKWNQAATNPVKEVKLFREPNGSLRVLSSEEEEKLLAVSAPHLKPIIITALNTGMRKGEILSLTWDRVENCVVKVENTKNGECRTIPMNQRLTDTLNSLKIQSEYVFCSKDGKQIKDMRKAFTNAIRRSGIDKCRFHDLRHTFATRLVMAGADLSTVQELLGHKTITMTMRYSHPTPRHRMWAVELLDLPKVPTISPTVPGKEREIPLCEVGITDDKT